MPFHNTVTLPAGVVTLISVGTATKLTVRNMGNRNATIMGAANSTPPAVSAPGIPLPSGSEKVGAVIADIFPGLSAAYLFAYSPSGTTLFVSHN